MKSIAFLFFVTTLYVPVNAAPNYCNYGFGKPEKKMKDGVAVPSLENKGQLVVINDNGRVNSVLVFDKKKDSVKVTIDGHPGTANQVSGVLVGLEASELRSASQVVINVTNNAKPAHNGKPATETEVHQYILVRSEASSVRSEKGQKTVAEKTAQCGFYFQAYFPPLEQLPLDKSESED